jgi:fumarylacetoacetate (FAA) hydrolase
LITWLHRNLKAGTIQGSGAVSSKQWKDLGSACLAERGALDIIEYGECKTDFLKFGEILKIEVFDKTGQSVFGAIAHKVVKS